MTTEPLYLRQDVQIEPLVDQWYAWSHLIPPATAARNITQRHMRLMDSYIDAPQVHANAVKNPKMRGGPFVDYGGRRVGAVRELRDATRRKRARLFQLSLALEQLDGLLRSASGYAIQGLYPDVPELLRGRVELCYDLHNRASFRVIEPLMYRSEFYDESAQSLMVSVTAGDERAFVMSTPRLEGEGIVHLPWRFADRRVDDLCQLKSVPRSWEWIDRRFDFPDAVATQFRGFLTTEPPPRAARYTGSGVRWRYFGHACILVETRDIVLLFDPVLSYGYDAEISRYTYADLPDYVDYVVITHNHQDHLLLETLLQIRHKVGSIIVPRAGTGSLQDPSIKLALEFMGFGNVVEMAELEQIDVAGGALIGIPFLGEHCDLAITTKLGYVLTLGEQRLLFAADSCNIEPRLYELIRDYLGEVGTLFIGMECDGAPLSWLYGPLLLRPLERGMDQSRRLSGCDREQASRLIATLGSRDIYIYAMGQEPWLNHVMSVKYGEQSRPILESNSLIAECRARGLVAERLFGEKEILVDSLTARAPSVSASLAQPSAPLDQICDDHTNSARL